MIGLSKCRLTHCPPPFTNAGDLSCTAMSALMESSAVHCALWRAFALEISTRNRLTYVSSKIGLIIIGITAVQKVGGDKARPERPKLEARRAESGGGVLGEGAASPLPTS